METLTLEADRAARALAETHGVTATRLTPLGSELASTFRAATDRGELAVKFQLSDPIEIEVQRWRADIAARLHAAGLPVPAVVPARDGSTLGATSVDGTPVAVLAIDWVDALPYADAELGPHLVSQLGGELGRVAARMQAELAAAPAPPHEIDHTWAMHDVARTIAAHLAPPHPRLPAEARLAGERALRIHERFIAPHKGFLPRALVHQDLHDSNVLVGPNGLIRAIIDFDDMVLGWRIAEPAVAAAYLARHAADPVLAATSVLAGWSEEVPVTMAEREAFLPLVAIRLALNTVVWAARAESDRGAYAAMRSRGSAGTFATLATAAEAEGGAAAAAADELRPA
ncbi:phosphotransferase [Leucobacter sp. CSA2]|uniref:Phosphotransferase n=1 Tax=Leucobacter edaphi TaxID=2796472 RepID=A0A934QCV9_9MICO|nr:phosphotransferase [Leucobacter edaphi]MBK0420727.1 phosphotransferase [Leucobacter edaphi]